MDISAIAGAFEGAKTARSLITGALQIRDEVQRNNQLLDASRHLIEVTDKLMASQLAQSELIQAKSLLEARVMELEGVLRQAESYALHELSAGVLVYASKPAMHPGEPAHYICPRCWDVDKKKSILQQVGSLVRCNTCNSSYPRHGREGTGRVRTDWNPYER